MFKPLSLAQYGKCYYRFLGESIAVADKLKMPHKKFIRETYGETRLGT